MAHVKMDRQARCLVRTVVFWIVLAFSVAMSAPIMAWPIVVSNQETLWNGAVYKQELEAQYDPINISLSLTYRLTNLSPQPMDLAGEANPTIFLVAYRASDFETVFPPKSPFELLSDSSSLEGRVFDFTSDRILFQAFRPWSLGGPPDFFLRLEENESLELVATWDLVDVVPGAYQIFESPLIKILDGADDVYPLRTFLDLNIVPEPSAPVIIMALCLLCSRVERNKLFQRDKSGTG